MTPSPFHGIFGALSQDQSTTETPHSISVEEHQAEDIEQLAESQKGQIAVDIFEYDNYYIIRAPIAGVSLSDLDIEVDEKTITISGERKMKEDVEQDQYYLQECFWGEFSRSVTLPCVVDPKKVKATFSKDSILKILIPKEEKVKIVRVNEA